MYSGTTFHNLSGNILGAHQKLDRAAFKVLKSTAGIPVFPPIRSIIHFEGKNGPDGIKRKSAGRNEPRHFYNPHDEHDADLPKMITEHYRQLVGELKDGNQERAAFEASWLAHALVDGLTPAHHYPYDDEMARLRGEDVDAVTTVKDKMVLKGDTKAETLRKNWGLWGAKGLFTTHALFELGVATLIAPLRLGGKPIDETKLRAARKVGVERLFRDAAREIAALDMYEAFYARGWTVRLSSVVKKTLAPKMVEVVALAWYLAAEEAGVIEA